MSYETRLLILQVAHALVGFWYLVLSLCFIAIFRHLRKTEHAISKRAETVAYIGSALFLSGCGVHHQHMAFETLRDAYTQGPLRIDVFVGDDNFLHHLVIQLAQDIGAPMVISVGLWLWTRSRLSVSS